ncbi:hypothetical protein ACUXAV_002858 [Cupriavidus metallidurans]|nr:hypothetical protein [Cupriavidus metallidurans]
MTEGWLDLTWWDVLVTVGVTFGVISVGSVVIVFGVLSRDG